MKTKITLLLLYLFLISNSAIAQITIDTGHFNWSKIEDASPVSMVYTDADNGDGLNDGAMLLKSTANTPALQGLQYQLAGNPLVGEQINLESKYYQIGASFVGFKMQVYNVTDNVVLAQSTQATTSSGVVGTSTLSYTFTASSLGDQIIVRFVRTDDLNPVRQAGIDYLMVNGQFISMQAPPVNFDVSDFAWSRIENANPVATTNNDADNGDGLNDGAMLIKGTANTPAVQGVQYLLSGSPFANGQINVEVKYYSNSASFSTFKIQVYNATDNVVLAESAAITVLANAAPGTAVLSHVFTTSSAGDQIMVRFVRTDDLNPVRVAALDYVKINGQFVNMTFICKPTFNFDLPLTTATTSEINDLAAIRTSLSNQLIGTTAPTTAQMNTAISQYNALNITVTGSKINGNAITDDAQISFLKTFVRYLKFNPNDASVADMAMKTVWYASMQNCNATNAALTFYNYPTLSRAAVFLNNYLPESVKGLFGNTLQTETSNFQYLFDSNYDFNTTQSSGAISTDVMYLDVDVLLAYADWFKTDDEKIRFLKTVKRFIDRYLIYTAGTKDGLKKDGTGYHHNVSYDGYMYNYGTVAVALKSLEGTNFQIDQATYLRLRDAVYAQTMYSNDAGTKPFAMAGRNPQTKTTTLSGGTLANLAISGGKILGLNTADPVLAGLYNRRYGFNSQFNYNTVTPFEEGYVQFNYGNLGVYRKNNWIASMKGQSDVLWGSEIYINQNRYGRYQSYGALDIIYPGNVASGNGYSDIGWDWNYNPGTTTIVLPWDKLQAEKERVDEYNTYGFAGSLTLNQANKSVLSKTMGQSGLFSMKFKERNNLGFGATYGAITHNATFEFTKTYFAIDDFIICLASGIKNNDTANPTVTTLFQKLNNNSNDVLVNGDVKTNQAIDSFDGTAANWIIDNYNTGYYILPNSGTLKIRNSNQITPYQNQVSPSEATIASNNGNNYHLAYLDHGTAPTNGSYEFVCIPSANASRMATFAQQMSSQDKPYVVYQNNTNQQIIEHKTSKTWAYALPAVNAIISDGLLKSNDRPCLVMYKSLTDNYSQIVLSVSNPDMGSEPSTPKIITLTLSNEWTISQGSSSANLGSASADGTTITFTVADGFPVEIKLTAVNPCTLPNATPAAPTLEITQPNCIKATGSIKITGSVENLSFSLDGTTFENTTGMFADLASGSYNVYAKNTGGCISTASSAVINIQPASPEAPVLIITQPTFETATGSIQVTENIENMSFSLDGITFENATGLFDNLDPGNYTVYAKNENGCISVGTNAVINAQPVAPTISITSPLPNSNYDVSGTITINADAADIDGSVSKVEFFQGEIKLGEITTAPYSFDWNDAPAGSYAITAKATDNNNATTISEIVNINVSCPTIQLSIPEVYAINPAVDDKNTIYLGYGPTSLTLNSLLQGNSDVAYMWNTGAHTPSISVSEAGTYTVTASYAGGCQSTASITINAIDVRCGNKNDKVQICHNNNVICVAQSAVQAHLNHGDKLGSCTTLSKMAIREETTNPANFTVYPNPIKDSINVSISSKLDPNATISIYNILGNKILQVHYGTILENVFVGNLPSGTYIVVVQNSFETLRSTIVKQ